MHFPSAHANIEQSELGFLVIGEAPITGVENVQMTLRLIGTNTPGPNTKEKDEKNEETVSENTDQVEEME